jgi:hypothetical protein
MRHRKAIDTSKLLTAYQACSDYETFRENYPEVRKYFENTYPRLDLSKAVKAPDYQPDVFLADFVIKVYNQIYEFQDFLRAQEQDEAELAVVEANSAPLFVENPKEYKGPAPPRRRLAPRPEAVAVDSAKGVEVPAKGVEVPAKGVEVPAKGVEVPAKGVEVPAQAGEAMQTDDDWSDGVPMLFQQNEPPSDPHILTRQEAQKQAQLQREPSAYDDDL